MSVPAVRFENVTVRYGRGPALDGIDFELERGRVLGLVGRNGAGKTTALRLAYGLLHADVGRVSVLGLDPKIQGLAVREAVSLLSEETALYPWMTVEEILAFARALHPRWDPALAARVGAQLELPHSAKISTLSRGTRAKVALVIAVASRPALLLLDDPTAGLDPLARREVLEGVLDAVVHEGGSVVYATHLVHDVERVADDLIVLDSARIVLSGELEEIKSTIRQATAVFRGPPPSGLFPQWIEARVEGRALTVLARAEHHDLEAELKGLGAERVDIASSNLEEILVALLRRSSAMESQHV